MDVFALTFALIAGLFPGTFASQTGKPVVTADLRLTPLGGGRVHFDIVQRRGSSVTQRYALDMTRLMHVIVISDDFSSFAHLHPRLLPSGHFVLDAVVPRSPYRVYADSDPVGAGQQVFRFDVGANAAFVRVVPSGTATSAGPYVVRLSATNVRVGSDGTIGLTILQDGRPASNLQPYLGAAGHAVFVNVRDYTYAHVHPMRVGAPAAGMTMESGPAEAGPHLVLHTDLREAGTYKLWFEFRGGGRLYVAPFVVTAD
jgi:hypothetical protein